MNFGAGGFAAGEPWYLDVTTGEWSRTPPRARGNEGPDAPPDDLACIVVPHVPYRSQIAKDNAQAAKDLAHLLRLLGVDSYEEATVVLFDLARRGHLPAAPADPKDAGAQ